MSESIPSLAEAMAEIRRLRARIEAMEAAEALRHGSMSRPAQSETISFTCNIRPSAPPHNERPPIGNDDE